ncbi:MAG: DUF4231 domain-containing protein [Anaerolineae bacterium]|nr:DUF4231 domain-containing protein [Anaerolineae bacterium]
MTSQPSTPTSASTSAPPPSASGMLPADAPISQGNTQSRANWPMWAKELPRLSDPQPITNNFQLIDPAVLENELKDATPQAKQRIQNDIKFMEHELLRLFRETDVLAKQNQNRYRLFQLGYIALAGGATLFGSLQALSLNTHRDWMPWLAFAETVIALFATYLATISGREPPMPRWLDNRRKAESMRREYFRYLLNLPPFDTIPDGPERRRLLSRRAADINRGIFPESSE